MITYKWYDVNCNISSNVLTSYRHSNNSEKSFRILYLTYLFGVLNMDKTISLYYMEIAVSQLQFIITEFCASLKILLKHFWQLFCWFIKSVTVEQYSPQSFWIQLFWTFFILFFCLWHDLWHNKSVMNNANKCIKLLLNSKSVSGMTGIKFNARLLMYMCLQKP